MASPSYLSQFTYIGVDPGTSGALAVLHRDEVYIFDIPHKTVKMSRKTKEVVDSDTVFDTVRALTGFGPCVAFIERVGGMPRQDATRAFTFGFTTGILHGAFIAAGVPVVLISPQAWKGEARLIGKDKEASCACAAKRFPAIAEQFYGPRGGAIDGRAEALLIADYGRKTWAPFEWVN